MARYQWKPYVPVAERRRKAAKKMQSLAKKGVNVQPVSIEGRTIARSFWGKSWCQHLENFSDYSNRLPRGRTYVRNGSVCHLDIQSGIIEAKVIGSELYAVTIKINKLTHAQWDAIKRRCAGGIGTLLELLQGKLSDEIMSVVTDPSEGLFPLTGDIKLGCSCPDGAIMCKHVAAVLYGVGARLDTAPELLFKLRGVHHEELIDSSSLEIETNQGGTDPDSILEADGLSDIFGIDIQDTPSEETPKSKQSNPKKKTARAKTTPKPKKKSASKKAVVIKKKLPFKKTALTKSVTKKKAVKKRVKKKIKGTETRKKKGS